MHEFHRFRRAEYKAGSNKDIDYAISKIGKVNEFLMQETYAKMSYDEEIDEMRNIFAEPGEESPTDGAEAET